MKLSPQTRKGIQKALLNQEKDLSNPCKVLLAALAQSDRYAMDKMVNGLLSMNNSGTLRAENHKGIHTFMIKPVGDVCNLKCAYCYEAERLQNLSIKSMSFETLRSILKNILPEATADFMIYFHGGEPLLRGIEFFEEAIRIVKKHPNGKHVKFGVQTNATRVDNKWCDLFKRHDIGVGISLDGNRETNNTHRLFQNGNGSFDKVMEGIECLKSNNIFFGVISVVTSDTAQQQDAPLKLFNFFLKNGIKNYDVHPAYTPVENSRDYNLNPQLYSYFMKTLFDIWLEHGDPTIQIRCFKQFFESLTGFRSSACYRSGNCQTIMGVDPSGITSPCTRPFNSKYNFGNLAEQSLSELLNDSPFQSFSKYEYKGQQLTTKCKWAHFCGYGSCPHERIIEGKQDISGKHIYCTCHNNQEGGYPEIFTYFYDRVEDVFNN